MGLWNLGGSNGPSGAPLNGFLASGRRGGRIALDVQAASAVGNFAGGKVPVALRGGGGADPGGGAVRAVAADGATGRADQRAVGQGAGGDGQGAAPAVGVEERRGA